MIILTILSSISLMIWLYLALLHGNFWNPPSIKKAKKISKYPEITILIPARNEAKYIKNSLMSLLRQNYEGKYRAIVVDDSSSDATLEIVKGISKKNNKIHVMQGKVLKEGWAGKVWAQYQGINFIKKKFPNSKYILFTDADIAHSPNNLKNLTIKAESESLDLVSLMVLLKANNFSEKILIPAFVFFFQKLYPFEWVNDPRRKIAAAAGGCMLVNYFTLKKSGGIEKIKNQIIDDCALARILKKNGRIWLGITKETKSLRNYKKISEIWSMVTRSAYDQLNYSILLLIICAFGMFCTYMIPVIALSVGFFDENNYLFFTGLIAWFIMSYTYIPTLRNFNEKSFMATFLPIASIFYTLTTIDSARMHLWGSGGSWKDRSYKNNRIQ